MVSESNMKTPGFLQTVLGNKEQPVRDDFALPAADGLEQRDRELEQEQQLIDQAEAELAEAERADQDNGARLHELRALRNKIENDPRTLASMTDDEIAAVDARFRQAMRSKARTENTLRAKRHQHGDLNQRRDELDSRRLALRRERLRVRARSLVAQLIQAIEPAAAIQAQLDAIAGDPAAGLGEMLGFVPGILTAAPGDQRPLSAQHALAAAKLQMETLFPGILPTTDPIVEQLRTKPEYIAGLRQIGYIG
jgi:DNA repair exonuclease SbcCD ATPase subunit